MVPPGLLRSEAASSSETENLTASTRAILSTELGLHRSRNADQIAANTYALHAALDLATDLSVDSLKRLPAVLMEAHPSRAPGRWREEPV